MTQIHVFENGVSRPMTEAEAAEWAARTAAASIAHAVDANVARAKAELVESDWAETPSVRSSKALPRLRNGAAFDAYRIALRSIAIGKPQTVEEWPARPKPEWITE